MMSIQVKNMVVPTTKDQKTIIQLKNTLAVWTIKFKKNMDLKTMEDMKIPPRKNIRKRITLRNMAVWNTANKKKIRRNMPWITINQLLIWVQD